MKVLAIAEAEELLREELVTKYTYNKSFEDASEEPFCVMHTSGSTGHPKPIFWKHSMLATLDATRLLPEHHGRLPWVVVFEEGDRYYSSFPFYHVRRANIIPFTKSCFPNLCTDPAAC